MEGTEEAPVEGVEEVVEVETQPAEGVEDTEATEEVQQPTEEDAENAFLAELFAPKGEASRTMQALDELQEVQGNRSWKAGSIEDALSSIENIETRDLIGKLLHNARSMGLRSTDQAARQLREIEAQREELQKATEKFYQERAEMWSMFKDTKLTEDAKPPEGEEPDFALDPRAWVAWHRQKDRADILADVFGRIGKVSDEHQAKVDNMLAERRRAEAKEKLGAWIKESAPDFWDYADDIEAAMKTSSLDAQDAYLLVKARNGGTPSSPAKDPKKAARARMRKQGRAVREQVEIPKDLDGDKLLRWADENQGAVDAYIESAGSLSLL